jgi:hypothetical protein
MILGVGHKMIPILTASTPEEERRSRRRSWVLNSGTIGLFIALVTRSRWVSLVALFVILGFASALHRLTRPWREGKPLRTDWSTRHVLAAFGFLVLALALGMGLALGIFGEGAVAARAAVTYGFLGLVGWISLMIVGMSYRVIPLLVGLHRYSPLLHDPPVPKVADLYSTRWQIGSYSLLVTGIGLTAVTLFAQSLTGLRAGLALISGGLVLFEANMVQVFAHLPYPTHAGDHTER